MKKTVYEKKYKPDPIVVGDPTRQVLINRYIQLNKSNAMTWKDERKLRDNGKVTK